jgi:hypothetical protein
MEGAEEGCDQTGVKAKLRERANTRPRENVVKVAVGEYRAIRL